MADQGGQTSQQLIRETINKAKMESRKETDAIATQCSNVNILKSLKYNSRTLKDNLRILAIQIEGFLKGYCFPIYFLSQSKITALRIDFAIEIGIYLSIRDVLSNWRSRNPSSYTNLHLKPKGFQMCINTHLKKNLCFVNLKLYPFMKRTLHKRTFCQ